MTPSQSYCSYSYHQKFDYLRKKKDVCSLESSVKPTMNNAVRQNTICSPGKSLNLSLDAIIKKQSRSKQVLSSGKANKTPCKVAKDDPKIHKVKGVVNLPPEK